jgi:hypothetical protein
MHVSVARRAYGSTVFYLGHKMHRVSSGIGENSRFMARCALYDTEVGAHVCGAESAVLDSDCALHGCV